MASSHTRKRFFAIGDPQAPIEKFMAILERHHVLDDRGRIASDAQLLSIGDHFDWGTVEEREKATRSGTEILAWLLSHPADQAIVVLGNHDLARVGELANFDEATYLAARAEADPIYRNKDRDAEAKLLEKYPAVPSAELLARDFSAFEVKQRELVSDALRSGRATLAYAGARDRLFVHAAVTEDDLAVLGLSLTDMEDAYAIAEAINNHVAIRVAAWIDGPLDLTPLHLAGDARSGEGRGIAYQRPSHASTSDADLFEGPPRRRFDPRRIPKQVTQIVGHIRDEKCRKLLGPWVKDDRLAEGALRSLKTDGHDVSYMTGVQPGAQMIFIDGSMRSADLDRYELYRTEL